MKLYHYCILFAIIAITLFVMADIKTNRMTVVAEEKTNLDTCFSHALDDGVIHLVESDGIENVKINKERAVNDFFLSLYASLDITSNTNKQELVQNYIPVILVTSEDGFYVYYSNESQGPDGNMYMRKQWSEKMPYYYEDEDFIYSFTLTDILTIYDKKGILDSDNGQTIFTLNYHELKTDKYSDFSNNKPDSFLLKEEAFYLVRKNAITTCLEETLAFYCNHHNSIAKQCGINYKFTIPEVDNSEWIRAIDNPSLFVLFQGYPLLNGVDENYNQYAFAGSKIKKDVVYYLEQKNWYYLYHKSGCIELEKEGIFFLDEPLYTIMECVKKGAYACPYCVPSGVHPADYKPW